MPCAAIAMKRVATRQRPLFELSAGWVSKLPAKGKEGFEIAATVLTSDYLDRHFDGVPRDARRYTALVAALKRIVVFIREMFPPWVMVPFGLAKFYAVYLTMQALAGRAAVEISPRSVVGAISVVLLLLLTRVFDELKDHEADRRMAAAGDPRYTGRPLVRGAVLLSDVITLRGLVIALLWGLQFLYPQPYMLVAFGVAFAALWLSSKWFFYPPIARSLLLAFVTHSPLTLVVLLYAYGVFAADFDVLWDGRVVLLLLGLWMPLAAWETSRKIRVPEDETAYQTYTQILGLRRAPLLPVTFVVIGTACVALVSRAAGTSWVFSWVLIAGALVPVVGCLRFIVRPTRRAAKLQPLTEFYGLVVDIGLPLSVVLSAT